MTKEKYSKKLTWTKCFSSHLNKVVRKEAPFPIEVSLHPAILVYVPHVLDDVAQSQGQLVVMERFVLVLHHNLYSRQDEGEKEGGRMVLEREEEITRGKEAAGVEREQRKDKSTEE